MAFRPVLLLLASSCLASPVLAQPVLAQQADGSEDIIVTALRSELRAVDVPASVTVLTADTIQQARLNTAQDFARLTPGVTIVTGTAEAGDTQINIRGINGARDAEPSVALVVDGILKTNTAQLNQRQGSLRQVELLKGPQGALYGRNAAAGAIVIQTLKPGDTLEAGVRGSYAEQNTIEGDAYVAAPLSDNLGFVLSGYYRSTDGFYRNSFLDRKVVDDQELWSLDGRLVWELGDATELDLKSRYAKLNGASINFNASFHLPNFAAVNADFYEDVNAHPFGYYGNIRPTNEQETFEVSAKLEHQFETAKLTAYVLYAKVDQALTADGTSADFARYIAPALGAPANPTNLAVSNACFASTAALTGFPQNSPTFIGNTPIPFIFDPVNGSTFGAYSATTCDGTQLQTREQEDFSGEVRFSGDFGPVAWQAGVYYLNLTREVGISLGGDLGQGVSGELYNAPGTGNPTSQLFHDRFKTSVYAAFGSANFSPSDGFDIGVALRYDIEDRSVENLVPFVTDPITGGPINPGQAGGPIRGQSQVFEQLQPKLTLRYALSDDINVFANWGVGFKSGGFNNQGSAAIVDQNFVQFIGAEVLIEDQSDKETSSAFEAGFKGSLFDGRVTFDLAGFYTKVTDMQFFEFFVGGFGLLRVVSNIDEVDLYGGELNLTATILDGWTLFGSANITESEIRKNSSRPSTVGNESPYTAAYTWNLGTQFSLPVSDGFSLFGRADWRRTGPTWFHTVQNQETPTLFSGLLPGSALGLPAFVGNARYDVARRDAFDVVNLRAGVEFGNLSVAVFAENVFDERFINEAIPAIEFGGSFISPGARRMVGVEAGFRF
ncbi:MAG: TonB-dependent receptor [Sandaracinobacteroides sp.]